MVRVSGERRIGLSAAVPSYARLEAQVKTQERYLDDERAKLPSPHTGIRDGVTRVHVAMGS